MGLEISAVENVGLGCGAAEKFSARAKNIQKISPKNFHVHWTLETHCTGKSVVTILPFLAFFSFLIQDLERIDVGCWRVFFWGG